MNITAKIKNPAAFAVTIDNQIRLIKRLVMPEWDRDKLKFGAMRDVWKSANPGRIELARGKKSGDFLIGASGNQLNRIPRRALKIRLQASKKLKVVGEKYRSETKSNGSVGSSLCCAANRSTPAGQMRALNNSRLSNRWFRPKPMTSPHFSAIFES